MDVGVMRVRVEQRLVCMDVAMKLTERVTVAVLAAMVRVVEALWIGSPADIFRVRLLSMPHAKQAPRQISPAAQGVASSPSRRGTEGWSRGAGTNVNRAKSGGITSKLRSVELKSPPRITADIGA